MVKPNTIGSMEIGLCQIGVPLFEKQEENSP